MTPGAKQFFCYEHERVHDEAEQAWYCTEGEWLPEAPAPQVSEWLAGMRAVIEEARDTSAVPQTRVRLCGGPLALSDAIQGPIWQGDRKLTLRERLQLWWADR